MRRIQFDIDENENKQGVKTMSIVDEPAIESNFIFFAKEKTKYIELKADGYKQVVAGLALIPDKDILRFDEAGEPYNAYFTAESIEKIRNKFHKEGLGNNVNVDHNSYNYIDAYLLESFIIDSEQRLADVKARGIEEATLGSWFVAYKIENQEVFKKVLEGELNGFSVEIFLSKFSKLNNNNTIENKIENVMNKFLEKFKALLSEFENEPEVSKLEVAKTKDGDELSFSEVGQPVLKGEEVVADGSYELEDGRKLKVESGVLAEIEAAEPEAEPEQEEDFKSEIEGLKAELAKANDEIKSLQSQLKTANEKLKKTPSAKPTVLKKTDERVDISKLSNFEREMLKYKN